MAEEQKCIVSYASEKLDACLMAEQFKRFNKTVMRVCKLGIRIEVIIVTLTIIRAKGFGMCIYEMNIPPTHR